MKSTQILTIAAAFLFGWAALTKNASAADAVSPAAAEKPEKPAPEDPLKNANQAKEVVRAFYASKSVEEMAKQVRHPEKTLSRMKSFYGQKTITPVTKLEFGDNITENDRGTSAFVSLSLTAGLEEIAAVVEVPAKGTAKLDWESLVGWCEMPWAKFVKDGSEKPLEFRVHLSVADYYNGSFADSAKYLCFRITDKANEATVYGYCEKDSSAAKSILGLIRRNRGPIDDTTEPISCILKMSMKSADVTLHQAVVDSLAAEGAGWVDK